MPRGQDLTGLKFNRLTALSLVRRHGHRFWLCRCDCGNEATVATGKLKNGHTKSCGCLAAETSPKNAPPIDRVGRRYGRLVVVSNAGTTGSGSKWLCLCDCGAQHVVRAGNLDYGNVKSCGCLSRESGQAKSVLNFADRHRRNRLPPGTSAARSLYAEYRKHALHRGLLFSVTIEAFLAITQQDCFYCGIAPHRVHKAKRLNGGYRYNGVDRLDNALGYQDGNMVPCCFQCNFSKHAMPLAEFYAWVDRLARRREEAIAASALTPMSR